MQSVTKKLERSMGNFANFHLEIKEDDPADSPEDDARRVQVVVTEENKDSIWDQIDVSGNNEPVDQPSQDIKPSNLDSDIAQKDSAEITDASLVGESEEIKENAQTSVEDEDAGLIAPNHDSGNV